MGSGKGQSRRVQTRAWASPTPEVVFSLPEWEQFVKGSEVNNMKLQQYYLGRVAKIMRNEDHQMIITELFRDAVAMDVISLPSSYSSEDFEFIMEDMKSYTSAGSMLSVRLKKRPELAEKLFNPGYRFSASTKMNTFNVPLALEIISNKVDELLSRNI